MLKCPLCGAVYTRAERELGWVCGDKSTHPEQRYQCPGRVIGALRLQRYRKDIARLRAKSLRRVS